jgi:hypothetical protein
MEVAEDVLMMQGILVPVLTPFDEQGLVDEPMLRKLVDFYVKYFPKWETKPMPDEAREALYRDPRSSGCLE